MEIGLLVLGEHTFGPLRDLAQDAEAHGYHTFWYADEKFYRDVYVGLTAVAMHTRRIRLGPCVTDPYARHPALTAAAMAALDELSDGRAVLGLGAGGTGFPIMGLSRPRPAIAIREAMTIMRALWNGESIDYQGEVISCHHGRLNFLAPRVLPIIVGTRGHHILKMAGAVADGVMIAPYASGRGLTYALDRIRQGAQDRVVKTIARVDICISDDDPQAARQAVKPMIALPLWNSYPNFRYLEAVSLTVPDMLLEQLAKRDYSLIRPSASLVPDDFVRHLAVAGSRAEVTAQIQEIAATGVEQITIHPIVMPGQTLSEIIRDVAQNIMPHVSS